MAEYDKSYVWIYDGSFNSLRRKVTITSAIKTGAVYKFRVFAINYNGMINSTYPVLVVYACGSPSQPKPVFKKEGTKESIKVGWEPPVNDGGCPIEGYQLIHDGGSNGILNVDSDINLKTNPQIFEKELIGLNTGLTYWFKVIAINIEGQTESLISAFMIAEPPASPIDLSLVPSILESFSNSFIIEVPAYAVVDNGGSSILGYEIQMDNGDSDDFWTIQGGELSRTIATKAFVTSGLIKSKTYRVWYWAINSIGPSEWSNSAEATIANNPEKPSDIQIVTVTNETITVRWS